MIRFLKGLSGMGCVIALVVIALLLIGEVKCVVKAVKCDWVAPYKAEAIYTGASLTGLGAIVGWIDIEDGVTTTEEQ